ncbi:MAG: hypothetical protein LC776_16520 [Acidobacteria bacterium]|nr:hypothetical protein [Acidobacteriota bacterium]
MGTSSAGERGRVRVTSSTSQRAITLRSEGQAWHDPVQGGDELPSDRSVIGLRQVDETALGPPFGRSESGACHLAVVVTAQHAMA